MAPGRSIPSSCCAPRRSPGARFDLPLAERLARAAVEAGAGFDAGLLLGQLYGWQGRPADAERQLAALADVTASDAQRAELASARMDVMAFGFNRIPDAVRIADEAEPGIADVTCRDHVTAYRARALGWSGRFATAARVAEPLLRRATGQTLIAASMAAATSMSNCGRISDAIEATFTGHAAHLALVGPPMTFSPTFHLYLRCLAFNCAGRLAEAQALGEAEYAKAVQSGSVEGQGCFSMFLTVTYIEQGRLAAAVRVGAEAAGICRQLGWALTMRMALTPYVRALATVGDVDGARAVLAELDARDIGVTDLASADLLRSRAWVQVAGGAPSDGHAYLEGSAAVARDGGANALESGALHDLARLGRAADVAPRLRELAAVCEGPAAGRARRARRGARRRGRARAHGRGGCLRGARRHPPCRRGLVGLRRRLATRRRAAPRNGRRASLPDARRALRGRAHAVARSRARRRAHPSPRASSRSRSSPPAGWPTRRSPRGCSSPIARSRTSCIRATRSSAPTAGPISRARSKREAAARDLISDAEWASGPRLARRQERERAPAGRASRRSPRRGARRAWRA